MGERGTDSLGGQDASLAASADIRWLGYSYLAFRLIHTLMIGKPAVCWW